MTAHAHVSNGKWHARLQVTMANSAVCSVSRRTKLVTSNFIVYFSTLGHINDQNPGVKKNGRLTPFYGDPYEPLTTLYEKKSTFTKCFV